MRIGPLFDAADPETVVETRTISTVAPQALFLLNHPFVQEQTRAFARRLLAEPGDDAMRIRRAYTLLYGRPATAAEIEIGTEFLKRDGEREAVWTEYCQILLLANEFVYVD